MKKLLAVLCALAVCLSFAGVTPVHHAHAEDACAHESVYYETHSEDYHYHTAYCESCGEVLVEKEEHTMGGYGWSEDGTHSAYCELCYTSYGEREACVMGSEYTPNWGEGTHSLGCEVCGRPMGEAVPCEPGGGYVAYYEDEGYHYTVCGVCGNEFNREACVASGDYWYVWEDDDTCIGHQAICAVCECGIGETLEHTYEWTRLNGIWCGYTCTVCGYTLEEVEHEWDPESYEDTGDGVWHSMTCVNCGGQGKGTHWCEEVTFESTGDLYTHQYTGICDSCGGTKSGIGYHSADSCDAEACAACGQEGALVFRDMIEHEVGEWFLEDGNHYQICANCEQKVNVGPCYYWCYEDGCYTCGQKNPDDVYHDNTYTDMRDDGHYWVCADCGAEEFMQAHQLSCSEEEGDYCELCGGEYPDLKPEHYYYTMNDEEGHWLECGFCGEKLEKEAHVSNCENWGYCIVCWNAMPEDYEYEHFEEVWMNTGDQHWKMCSMCNELLVEATDHTPSAEDEDICSVCNGKIGGLDHEHGWKTREIPATCTKDGFLVDNCPICGIEMGRIRVKAQGHQYGEFTDNGDGTQTAACTVCGETITEEIATPAAEGENVPADAQLVVDEETEVTLAEETAAAIPGTVEKAFTVTLIVEGEEAKLAGKATVKLPLSEDEIAALEGKVLMVIGEDGVPVEIEYQIVENEMVFETEVLGVFVIVAKAA